MVKIKEGIAELIERGGVHRDVRGSKPREVLKALIEALPPGLGTQGNVPADALLKAVLEREDLMSTGIGCGIALPHPRNPLVKSEGEQFAALAFLEKPVDWNSLDGERVDTLLLIVAASAKRHLEIISEISFFCRQEDFYRMLKERSPLEELLRFIREAEKNWA